MSGLISDFSRFARRCRASPLAGPSLGAPAWARELGRFLAAEPRVGLVTSAPVSAPACYTPRNSPRYPKIAKLLSPTTSIGLADSFAPYVRIAHAHGLAVRIDELGTVSCGAIRKVSDRSRRRCGRSTRCSRWCGSAIHGVNIHTFPGAGYELFRIRARARGGRRLVAPEYYGLMMFARRRRRDPAS